MRMRTGATVFFVLALFTLVGALPFQAASLLPVGYWNLDDAASPALDKYGGANGTWNGAPTRVTTGLPTVFSYPDLAALSFTNNGTDQYVQIPNSAALDALQSNSYSISVWYFPLSVPAGTGTANNAAYGIVIKPGYHEGIIYDNAQHFEFQHWMNGTSGPTWTGTGSWNTAYPPGAWYHVVAVWDNTAGNVQMWVNGTQQGTATETPNSQNISYGTASWYFGIANPGAGNYRWGANGIIDDVRLYNYALNPTEIQVLATGCPAPSALTATPGVGQVTLKWTAPTGPAVPYTYNVYRGTASKGETLLMSGVTATTFVDTGVAFGSTYYYYVTAVSVAESGPTNEVSCSVAPVSITPASLSVGEVGGTATFTLSLLSPLANAATMTTTATVVFTSPNPPALLSEGAGTPAVSLPLQFVGDGVTLLSQTLTVTGVDDHIANDPLTATISFSTTSCPGDATYNNVVIPPVSVTQIEGDTLGLLFTPSSGLTLVDGGPAVQFTLQATSIPQTNVVVNLTISDPKVATITSPVGPITLTDMTPVLITVTPMDDHGQDPIDFFAPQSIQVSAVPDPSSSDAAYRASPGTSITLGWQDNYAKPPLPKVWGSSGCGLLGLDVLVLWAVFKVRRHRRRRAN